MEAQGRENWSIVHRRQALAAALPLLLYGVGVAAITLFLLATGGPSQIVGVARAAVWHNLALAIGAITLAALVGAAVAAIRGRLPLWSYTWVGAGLTGLLVMLNLVVEDRGYVISPAIDLTMLALFSLSGLVTFGRVAARGWQHAGLYSMGVSATLGMSLCFFGIAGPFESNLGLLAVLLGAVEAVLVYGYVRGARAVRIVALLGVGAANAAVSWIVESLFRASYPSRDISQFWYLVAILTVVLYGGTLLGLPGRWVGRVLGRRRGQR